MDQKDPQTQENTINGERPDQHITNEDRDARFGVTGEPEEPEGNTDRSESSATYEDPGEGSEPADAGGSNADSQTAAPGGVQDDAPEGNASENAGDHEEQQENPEVKALTEQVQELQNRLLRLQADFDNFRRRTRMEKEEFANYASQKLVEKLLPLVDNFERALAASQGNKDFDAFLKGIDMIYRQMAQVLEQEGLKPIEALGRPFNPEYHQAVMVEQSGDHEEGIVIEELQKGYMFKDKVIRPSMVKVSS